MKTYTIISNINIEHQIQANSEEEALDIHANQVELPKEYVSGSWELENIIQEDICAGCSEAITEADSRSGDRHSTCI